jgi:phage tail tape-measure protein
VAPLAKLRLSVEPDGTVNELMTTLEHEERLDAEETELTVQVERLAISVGVPMGLASAKRAVRAARRMEAMEIIVRDVSCGELDRHCQLERAFIQLATLDGYFLLVTKGGPLSQAARH